MAEYGLDHVSPLARAIANLGIAVCSLEYRRLGDDGGGWPNTFTDIGYATDLVREIANQEPLNLEKVVVMGHSAGAHLALWVAARHCIPVSSEIYRENPLMIKHVVSLAGIGDLNRANELCICDSAGTTLIGGTLSEYPERYAAGSPAALMPAGVPQTLISGELDDIVPMEYVKEYFQQATVAGDKVRHITVPQCGHFELIVPGSFAWPTVQESLKNAFLL